MNGVLKRQAFKALKDADAEIRVYPDIVGIDLREESPGCLGRIIALLPGPLRAVLLLLFNFVEFCFNIVGGFFGLIIVVPVAVLALLLLLYRWDIAIPAIIVAGTALVLWEHYSQKRLSKIAQRIWAEPKSSYAVQKLRRYYTPIVPRYWQQGDRVGEVMQILRAETRHRLLRRSLVAVVQDNPLEKQRGFRSIGVGLRSKRRIFVFAMDGGEQAADQAAAAMFSVLGVPVRLAEFKGGFLLPL